MIVHVSLVWLSELNVQEVKNAKCSTAPVISSGPFTIHFASVFLSNSFFVTFTYGSFFIEISSAITLEVEIEATYDYTVSTHKKSLVFQCHENKRNVNLPRRRLKCLRKSDSKT